MKKVFFVLIALFSLPSLALERAPDARPTKDDSRSRFEGRYEVPVPAGEEELQPFASFPLTNISRRVRGGVARIEYDLPLELTGVPNTIELSSQADASGAFRQWSGPLGTATCADNACNVAYKDLQIDMAAIEARLVGQGLPATEIEMRLRLAGHFRDDPHGRVIGERQIEDRRQEHRTK